jgi:hypothetical protein
MPKLTAHRLESGKATSGHQVDEPSCAKCGNQLGRKPKQALAVEKSIAFRK